MTSYRERHLAGIHAAPDQQSDLTVDQLKDQLRAQGKPVSGSKDELLARLAEPADENEDDD